jgi:transcriptional regulator with XRE-family HTH domain
MTKQAWIFIAFSPAIDYPSGEKMARRTERLLAQVKAWCDQERGRQSQLARFLGVSRQTVSDWFKPEKKKNPTAEQALAMLEWLKKPRRKPDAR